MDPRETVALPFGEAIGGIHAEHICSGRNEGRNPFLIITGVDSGSAEQPFMGVEQLQRILLVVVIVFTENQSQQMAVLVDHGKLIELMFPDDVVRFGQAHPGFGVNNLIHGRHEITDFCICRETGNTVIPRGDQTEKLAIRTAVIGNGDG